MKFNEKWTYVASVSFGKDSLAMLLLLIEKGYPLDEVVFYNTGMEFECIYKIRDKVKKILEDKQIPFSEIFPPYDFEYKMLEKPIKHRDGSISKGYGWCGNKCRWGTRDKTLAIKKYLKKKYFNGYYEYIGIAVDETNRIENNKNEKKLMPLVEWNMTEKDCLEFCYKQGYNWEENGVELYSVLDRVSCWCCSNKNLKELNAYYKLLPEYWDKLKYLQSKIDKPLYNNKKTIFEIEEELKSKG